LVATKLPSNKNNETGSPYRSEPPVITTTHIVVLVYKATSCGDFDSFGRTFCC
jgi:hypothetical protein